MEVGEVDSILDMDLDIHTDTVEDITHTTQTIHTITHTTMITMITIIRTTTTTIFTMIMIPITTIVMSLVQHKNPLLLTSKQQSYRQHQSQKDRTRQMQLLKVSVTV